MHSDYAVSWYSPTISKDYCDELGADPGVCGAVSAGSTEDSDGMSLFVKLSCFQMQAENGSLNDCPAASFG